MPPKSKLPITTTFDHDIARMRQARRRLLYALEALGVLQHYTEVYKVADCEALQMIERRAGAMHAELATLLEELRFDESRRLNG